MAAPRILLTTLLSCTAVVVTVTGLTSCTPADENPTVVSASDEVGGADDDDPGDPADAPDDAVEAAPTAPTSSGYCAPAGERPGHSVLRVVAADTVDPAELTARTTRYLCGPNRFEPVGSPMRYSFAAAGVDATLVDRQHGDPHGDQYGDPARPVPLPELLNHLDDCLSGRAPAAPYGCYGNTYDVVLDSHGRIMRITELARP